MEAALGRPLTPSEQFMVRRLPLPNRPGYLRILVARDRREAAASPTPPPASVERPTAGGASPGGSPPVDLAAGAEGGTDVLL